MDILETAEKLVELHVRDVRATFNDGTVKHLRLFKSTSGDICYLARRRKRYGYHLPWQDIKELTPIVSRKSQDAKWRDGWEKVRAKLIESGLWSEVVADIDIALKVGYDRMKKAYDDYWEVKNYQYDEFAAKYPELVCKNEEGKTCVRCSLVWNYSKLPKVKKMRFYPSRFFKEQNEAALQAIAQAMKSKKDCHQSGRAAYDVSFSYNAEKAKAWYSEEYKGCGNGHYYIAISSTHALYVEDD